MFRRLGLEYDDKWLIEKHIDEYTNDDTNPFFVIVWLDAEENAWYDECGQHITNIYELLTPKQIYLFRQKKESIFPLRGDRALLVHILVYE